MKHFVRGAVLVVAAVTMPVLAASPPGADKPAPSARERAPVNFDPTGYWVSLVYFDWRYRMVVPGRGEYGDIPISLHAKQFADAWDPTADEAAGKQCEAYGAGVLMEVPTRLHISWQDDDTLKVEADAGTQTRLLRFKPSPSDAGAPRSWQGYSIAQWKMYRPPGAPFAPRPLDNGKNPHYGQLEIHTSNLLAGLLRKNGLPYSERASMTEYWEIHTGAGGQEWLTDTVGLTDPEDLHTTYRYNAVFQKESDASKWNPTPCTLRQ